METDCFTIIMTIIFTLCKWLILIFWVHIAYTLKSFNCLEEGYTLTIILKLAFGGLFCLFLDWWLLGESKGYVCFFPSLSTYKEEWWVFSLFLYTYISLAGTLAAF